MESEIREQPRVLANGATSFAPILKSAVHGQDFDMVLLAARGSSDNAALYARYLIEVFLGIPVSLAAPSVLTRYGSHVRYHNCLAVGISQSGAAPDVAEVMADLREKGHRTVSITNTAGSRLTQVSDHTLLLNAGLEKSVAATKTYSTSLLAMYELVRAMGADLPASEGLLPTDAWIEETKAYAEETSGTIVRSVPSFSLGRGFEFSTAQESALKLMECALIPCKAYSSADFEHGPKALAGYGSAVISFGGDMPELAKQGCKIVVAPKVPDNIPEPLAPIWHVIFGQWLALTVARARGLNPDDPQHIQKVTQTR